MEMIYIRKHTSIALCALAFAAWHHTSWAESGSGPNGGTSGASASGAASASNRSGPGDTVEQLKNATQVVKQMESDPEVQKLLQQAKGVFIVPQYGRGGLGVGGRGGEGVFLANNGGTWSNPVFYNFGGVSVGAQAGAEIGSVAMLLMNEKAVRNFTEEKDFSMTADAGLTIVNYTAKARITPGKGDVVVWSDTKGAFANATVGITGVNYDDDENAAFYKSRIAAKDIVSGRVKSPAAASLIQELSSGQ